MAFALDCSSLFPWKCSVSFSLSLPRKGWSLKWYKEKASRDDKQEEWDSVTYSGRWRESGQTSMNSRSRFCPLCSFWTRLPVGGGKGQQGGRGDDHYFMKAAQTDRQTDRLVAVTSNTDKHWKAPELSILFHVRLLLKCVNKKKADLSISSEIGLIKL